MIRGLTLPEIGAILLADVRLVGSDEVNRILFVVDTGAAYSLLMPHDLPAFRGLSLDSLGAGPEIEGLGGSIRTRSAPAVLSFRHDNNARSTFFLTLALDSEEGREHLPSILGRDVLFRGQVHAGRDGVTFDVEPGEHDLSR